MLACGPGYCQCPLGLLLCPPRFAAVALWVGSHGDSDDCDRELWSIGVKTASERTDQLYLSSG